jgi:hypothetical protein
MSSSLLEPYPQHYKTALSIQHSASGTSRPGALRMAFLDEFVSYARLKIKGAQQSNC